MGATIVTVDTTAKQVATAVARAALAGYQLVRLADGTFLVSRWNLIRPLESLVAVNVFLAAVGAA